MRPATERYERYPGPFAGLIRCDRPGDRSSLGSIHARMTLQQPGRTARFQASPSAIP